MTDSREARALPSLLPCPHCGKQPEFYRCSGYDTFQSVIACCGFTHQDFEDAIVKAWNTRAPVSESAPVAWLVKATRGDKVHLCPFADHKDADRDAYEWRINNATTEIVPLFERDRQP